MWAGEWVKRKRTSTRWVVHSVPRGTCVCAPVLGKTEAKEEASVLRGPGLVIHTVPWQSEHRHRGVTGGCPPHTDTSPCRAGPWALALSFPSRLNQPTSGLPAPGHYPGIRPALGTALGRFCDLRIRSFLSNAS